MNNRFILSFCVLFLFSAGSYAQGCCSGGVSSLGNLPLSVSRAGQIRQGIIFDYNRLATFKDGRKTLDKNSNRLREVFSWLIQTETALSRRLSLISSLPIIRQSRSLTTLSGDRSRADAFGLGDWITGLNFRSDESRKIAWQAGAAIKWPTGVYRRTDDDGLLLSIDLQPGSGSTDGIFWLGIGQARLIGEWGLSGRLTGRISGSNRNRSDFESYRIGNEFWVEMGMGRSLFWKNTVIDANFFVRARQTERDTRNGLEMTFSGGRELHLNPVLRFSFSPKSSLLLNFSLPFYRQTNEIQLSTTWKAGIGFFYDIKSPKPKINL